MAKVSAGLLLFRRKPNFQVLLAHPGAPFWQDKDEGVWSFPKGIIENNESKLESAKKEFGEKMGFIPTGDYIDLGSVQQNDDKKIIAWGIEHQIPDDFTFIPAFFDVEWPPNSGQIQEFPEFNRIEYLPPFEANNKITPEQRPFISRLLTVCSS